MFLARIAAVSLLLALIFTNSSASRDIIIRQITIAGNSALKSQLLLELMNSRPAGVYDSLQLRLDCERIAVRYRQEGYYLAEVSAGIQLPGGDSTRAAIRVAITEGPLAIVGRMEIEGNTVIPAAALLEGFEMRAGSVVVPEVMEKDIRSVVMRYERIGFPYISVSVGGIAVIPGDSLHRLAVQLVVDEGPKVSINEIRVQGNKETSEHVIVRESRISPPELYNEDKVAKIRQRLAKLNIFSKVEDPELYVGSNGDGVLLSVEEGSTNTFDGVIGYVPGNQTGESGFLTGMVNVTMRNLFGTARKFDVRWQRDDRESQEIGLQYAEPWVFDVPVNLSGNFFQRQQDSIYVRRILGARAEIMFSDAFSLGGSVQQENIIPSSTVSAQAVSNSRTLAAGITLLYDSRDDAVVPTSGVRCSSDYLIGGKKVYGAPNAALQGNSTVHKVSIDAELYVQPVERQVVALGMHGRELTSDNIEISDRYRFGGANTLRGFRENQFIGSRIAWTNTEYRFLLERRTYVYGFFDTGYYFVPADDRIGVPSAQHVTFGYGVGVRVETAIGNVGVSIALGEGDAFSQAKLHLGLINSF